MRARRCRRRWHPEGRVVEVKCGGGGSRIDGAERQRLLLLKRLRDRLAERVGGHRQEASTVVEQRVELQQRRARP